MNSAFNVAFSNVFKHDPQPEDAGTIRINANIIGGVDTLTFTTTSFIEEFLDEENEDNCQSKQDVNYFLMEAQLNNDVIWVAMCNLILYVDELTEAVSNEDLRRSSLEVKMDVLLHEPDDLEIEEAIQASLNQTNYIRFRPASKFVVKSLTTKWFETSHVCPLCRFKLPCED